MFSLHQKAGWRMESTPQREKSANGLVCVLPAVFGDEIRAQAVAGGTKNKHKKAGREFRADAPCFRDERRPAAGAGPVGGRPADGPRGA